MAQQRPEVTKKKKKGGGGGGWVRMEVQSLDINHGFFFLSMRISSIVTLSIIEFIIVCQNKCDKI